MEYKSGSWKQKIDPAFDKFIKLFIELLEAVKLPANEGYINISTEDPHFEMLKEKEFPDFKSYYEAQDESRLVSLLGNMLGDIQGGEQPLSDLKELTSNFVALWSGIAITNEGAINSVIEKVVGAIDEESRNYYVRCFSLGKTEINKTSPQDQAKAVRFLISNILSLFVNRTCLIAEKNRDGVKELNVAYLQSVLFSVWNVISVFTNNKTLGVLYKEAKGGSDKSLFKLIRIDKTLFDHDWVRDRIREAAYSGERDFFQGLSKAVYDDPLRNRKLRIKEFLVLAMFWEAGLYRLSVRELLELFNNCDLAKREDEVTFRKFRDRFIKNRPKLWAISNLF